MNGPDGREKGNRRVPPALLAGALLLCVITGFAPPAGHTSYLLEVAPGLVYIAVLAALYRRLPLSNLVYAGVVVHLAILVYGGIYTYAETPLGNWAQEAFDLSRNHYDRVGHLALGFFPALTAREILLRRSPLERGGWLFFLTLCVIFAIGAFWELLEWWATLVFAADVGHAFLGSQGDIWDAQWDMFLVGVGAALALGLLARAQDRGMAAVDEGTAL